MGNRKKGLLNSNVVIDYDKDTVTDPVNQLGALERVESKIDEGREFFVSEITVLEMLKGFVRMPRVSKEDFEGFQERLTVFLQSVARKLPIDTKVSERTEKNCFWNFAVNAHRQIVKASYVIC